MRRIKFEKFKNLIWLFDKLAIFLNHLKCRILEFLIKWTKRRIIWIFKKINLWTNQIKIVLQILMFRHQHNHICNCIFKEIEMLIVNKF